MPSAGRNALKYPFPFAYISWFPFSAKAAQGSGGPSHAFVPVVFRAGAPQAVHPHLGLVPHIIDVAQVDGQVRLSAAGPAHHLRAAILAASSVPVPQSPVMEMRSSFGTR